MGEVVSLRGNNLCFAVARIKQELFNLMAANITKNATEAFLKVEPVRAARSFTVWPHAQRLNHPTNCAVVHQLPGKDRTFDVKSFAVIHRIFASGFGDFRFSRSQLFEGGQRCFIGEIVFSCIHHFQAKRATFIRNRRSGNQFDARIGQYRFKRRRNFRLRILLNKLLDFLWIRIVNPFQRRARFNQAIAHAVDMAVIERGGGKNKIIWLHDWLRFAFWRVIHTVFNAHVYAPLSISLPNGIASSLAKFSTEADFSKKCGAIFTKPPVW
ncbi:hypothetical protein D3C75_657880 [compost metagenome]